MSQEDVESVRKALEAYGRRDVEGFLAYLNTDFELRSAIVGRAEGSVYWGHDEVRQWFTDSDGSFAELVIEAEEFRDLGRRVLMFGRIRARGRDSGLKVDSATGWVFDLRDGKLIKAEGFLSRAEALAAAGLAE